MDLRQLAPLAPLPVGLVAEAGSEGLPPLRCRSDLSSSHTSADPPAVVQPDVAAAMSAITLSDVAEGSILRRGKAAA